MAAAAEGVAPCPEKMLRYIYHCSSAEFREIWKNHFLHSAVCHKNYAQCQPPAFLAKRPQLGAETRMPRSAEGVDKDCRTRSYDARQPVHASHKLWKCPTATGSTGEFVVRDCEFRDMIGQRRASAQGLPKRRIETNDSPGVYQYGCSVQDLSAT